MEFHVCVVASIPRSSQDNGWRSWKDFRALYERIYCSPKDARSPIFLVDLKSQPRVLHVSHVLFLKILVALSTASAIRGCELKNTMATLSCRCRPIKKTWPSKCGWKYREGSQGLSKHTCRQRKTTSLMLLFLRKLKLRAGGSRAFSCSKILP
jgi:hypothetical protein